MFPQQQQEAVAAYPYLVGNERIDTSRILVHGGSAGGHSAISCLIGIAEAKLPEPGILPGSEAVACGLIDIAQHMGFEVMGSDVG